MTEQDWLKQVINLLVGVCCLGAFVGTFWVTRMYPEIAEIVGYSIASLIAAWLIGAFVMTFFDEDKGGYY